MKVSWAREIFVYSYSNIFDNLILYKISLAHDHFKKLRDILAEDFLNN